MKSTEQKLLPKAPLAIVVAAVAFALFVCLPPHQGPDSYMAAINDKDAALRHAVSPKLVLVGGSNLAFGMDSQSLQRQLPVAEVVNMGLHAGFGLDYMLKEVAPHIRAGDVVVIVPEYEQFFGMSHGHTTELFQLLEVRPQAIRCLANTEQLEVLGRGLGDFLRRKFNCYEERTRICFTYLKEHHSLAAFKHFFDPTPVLVPYTRSSFNQRGDVVAHKTLPAPGFGEMKMTCAAEPDRDAIDTINSFAEAAIKQHARVFLCPPCIPRKLYLENRSQLGALYKELSCELRVPILSSFDSYVLPDQFFYDTYYHLTAGGIDYRVRRMAFDLRQELGNVPIAKSSVGDGMKNECHREIAESLRGRPDKSWEGSL
ncbi:MAG TPA: hypothetical protein V6D17_08355 [Candidatus Obscuribacterales bacterium]